MRKLTILVLWAAIAYTNWGLTMGWFTHEFPDQNNVSVAVTMAMMGPFALPAVLIGGQPMYWRVKPLTTEQRWAIFNHKYPTLGRNYFDREY